MKQYTFDNGVVMNIHHDKQYLETVFPNGQLVPAVPEPNDPPFAKEIGYEDRVWEMNWHHEFIHNWLACYRGMYSYVLKYVAEGGTEPNEETGKEEAQVIAIQRALNGQDVEIAVGKEDLESLKKLLKDLEGE